MKTSKQYGSTNERKKENKSNKVQKMEDIYFSFVFSMNEKKEIRNSGIFIKTMNVEMKRLRMNLKNESISSD